MQDKGSTLFLSYFKTLSIGPAPGIEPATCRSAVKHSILTELILCGLVRLPMTEGKSKMGVINRVIVATESELEES